MSVVLGFSCTSHDSSATLFIDGKLVAAIAEERLTRIKCTGKNIPRLAIEEVPRHGGVTRADVTNIAASTPASTNAW